MERSLELHDVVQAVIAALREGHVLSPQEQLAVTPGKALILAGTKVPDKECTLEQIEVAAYTQIHRGTFPFPCIRLGGGRRNWVVPVEGIRATLAAKLLASQQHLQAPPEANQEAPRRGRRRKVASRETLSPQRRPGRPRKGGDA